MPSPGETSNSPALSGEQAARVGISAQRKAAWRLLPILSSGYGLAYIDRVLHCVVPCCTMAAGYFVAGSGGPGWLVVTALAVPTQFMAGRAAAAGIANETA